jgi:lysozyme
MIVAAIIGVILVAAGTGAFLIYNGVLHVNNPSDRDYPVKGIDVSNYQGDIDWDIIAGQNVKFAFIKATEGSSYLDRYFAYNLENALKTDLYVGAYHFFSFDSPGASQAAHFIATVPKDDRLLPPVVDFEFYGDKKKNPPVKEDILPELKDMLRILHEYYGKRPILYVTKDSYDLYIARELQDYEIWYRDIWRMPRLIDGREWLFWQYSNRHRIDGYSGEEKYIDFNVFKGSWEEFEAWANT